MAEPVPYADWKPTPQWVANMIRTRTGVRSNVGATVDQSPPGAGFSDQTVETTGRITSLIDQEAPVVRAVVGEPCPSQDLADLATQALGYRVAAAIAADGGRSGDPNVYREEADALLGQLRMLAVQVGEGDAPGPADNTGLMAGSFAPSPLQVVDQWGYLRPRAI